MQAMHLGYLLRDEGLVWGFSAGRPTSNTQARELGLAAKYRYDKEYAMTEGSSSYASAR